MSERTDRLLAIAAEIVALEAKLAAKKAEFSAIATSTAMRVGDRGRPTMRTRIIELFQGSVELSGAEVKAMLPQFKPGSLDVQLGRCVERGILERVRWGVYRRATTEGHAHHDSDAARHYVHAHADVPLPARSDAASAGVGTRSVPCERTTDEAVDAERAQAAGDDDRRAPVSVTVDDGADDPPASLE